MPREYVYGKILDATVVTNIYSALALSTGTLVPASDTVWNSTLLQTQKDFAAVFAGCSGTIHLASTGDKVKEGVIAQGEVEFDCASGTWGLYDLVGMAKASGNALENRKVAAVSTIDAAIGYIAREEANNTTKVLVRIFERASGMTVVPTDYFLKDGSIAMTGALDMDSHKVENVTAGSATGDAVNYDQVILADGTNAFSDDQDMGGNVLTSLGAAVAADDAARISEVTAPTTATITLGAEDGGDAIAATIQLKDALGIANLAEKRLIDVWFSAANGGASEAITEIAVTTGVALEEVLQYAHYRIVTDATGKAVATFDKSGGVYAGYVCVGHNDRVTTEAIAWA